jgi:maltose/moltooligosaccharide transporter
MYFAVSHRHHQLLHMNYKVKKKRLSFWQIWNMSFGFFGIQFGFELQNSNVSRIFETLGANKDEIPILWIAAPLTGLLIQPIIGYLSDHTWHPYWGRRRPYFFIGAVLATMALFVMPNSSALWIAGGMLWILDASINISMEPFRAFVGDKLSPEQRTTGFAMQSFFIGAGSVIAALLPWIFKNWFHLSNTAPAGIIPDSVKWSFYVGAFAFLIAVLFTVFTTKEFPPEDMERFKEERRKTTLKMALTEPFTGVMKMPATMRQLAWVQFFTWFALFAMWIYATNAVTSNIYNMKVNRLIFEKLDADLGVQLAQFKGSPDKLKLLRALQTDASEVRQFQQGKEEVSISINLANYFSTSAALSENERVDVNRVKAQYNDGADWLGVCSSVRNGVAALFAFLIPLIARYTSRKKTHMLCLILGGIGLLSIRFITDPQHIAVSMGLVGIAWASILSMPYAMLAGALPPDRMGYFMGVFNFFIVIPQIVAATILGYFTMHFFSGNTMTTLALGGISMIFAGLLTLSVKDE